MSKAKKQRTESASGCSECTKEKIQTSKNGISLDENIPQHLISTHHVLRVVDEVWEARLNLSNSAENNNKFYIIQMLQPDDGEEGTYYVWNRWGRVGKILFEWVI